MKPVCRREFVAQEIVDQFPARLHDRNKRVVFDRSSPPGSQHSGTILFTRWMSMPLPEMVSRTNAHPVIEVREDYFTYEPQTPGQVEWHLNFSHCDLFCAYGGALFAQDEMQVAEHPALASLRHALIECGIEPLTIENDVATPILIAGVERRCSVATDPNAAEGRPFGLYGNNFSCATEDAIRSATRIIDPPSISNILAMEAPACGFGRYSRDQIQFILSTSVTGFRAAVLESRKHQGEDVKTAIHTGYWGCGAYGGNRVLMPLLQLIAAYCAEVEVLIFHSGGDPDGFLSSLKKLDEILPMERGLPLDELIKRIEAMEYKWGVSDGN